KFEPPFLQQRDPGAEQERFADVVGDEKRGLAEGSLHPREALLHLKPRHRVERRERFIQQQQRRIRRQRARDTNPLLFAAGELSGTAPSVSRRRQSHDVKQLYRASSYSFLRPAFQLRNDAHVFSHGRVREKPALLDHVSHTPPQTNRVPVFDGLAFEPYFATRGLNQPIPNFEKVILPRAAPPQQRHRFALFDAQVDTVENLTAADLVSYTAKLDQDRHQVTLLRIHLRIPGSHQYIPSRYCYRGRSSRTDRMIKYHNARVQRQG